MASALQICGKWIDPCAVYGRITDFNSNTKRCGIYGGYGIIQRKAVRWL